MLFTQQEWYTPAEVAIHNKATDCWVSLDGIVYDLTSWFEEQFKLCNCKKTCSCVVKTWFCCDQCIEYCNCFKRGYSYCDAKRQATTILAYAGKDISHWFKDGDWARYIHPITGTNTTHHQHGHGLREPVVPSTLWRPVKKPWWLNQRFVVGKVTAKTRPIRITNTLTSSTVTLEVCSEETIYQIMMRYLPYNTHMMSYNWRYLGHRLNKKETLAQNGIPDERDKFAELNLPENTHIPSILLFYNDDMTEDPPRTDCICIDNTCALKRPENCYDGNVIHK